MRLTRRSSWVEHFQVWLIAVAGVFALVTFVDHDTLHSHAIRLFYALWGLMALVGAISYYLRPRTGSILLIFALLCLVPASPLLQLPAWTDASVFSRALLVCSLLIAIGIVSGPLIDDGSKMHNQSVEATADPPNS